MQVVGEYVYTLDNPRTFRRDPSEKQNDLRLSELMAVGLDRLIVLERTEQTTKLYEIDLGGADNILATPWDDPATRPTLEQTDITTANIKAVPKNYGSTAPTSRKWPARRKAWRCSATEPSH